MDSSGHTKVGMRSPSEGESWDACCNMSTFLKDCVIYEQPLTVYDKIQNKVPKNKFVVRSCFCMKEMW